MSSSGGTIYAIGAEGTSWVKIGCTTRPVMQRLQTLQTGQPFPLQVLAAIPVETDAHRIERQVHTFLEAAQRRGEWFEVPMDLATLETLIVRAVAYLTAQEAPQDDDRTLVSMPDTTQRPLITGSRLRELRKASGKTQVELAQELGVQQAHISQLEAGRGELSVALLVRLAQVFGVTTDYLVGLSDHPALLAAMTPPTDAARLPGPTGSRHQGRGRKAVPAPVQEETCATGRN